MTKIFLNGLGNEISIDGTILKEFKYGFNTKNGGWSLYKINDEDKEAIFIEFKIKNRRKCSYINKQNIIRFE